MSKVFFYGKDNQESIAFKYVLGTYRFNNPSQVDGQHHEYDDKFFVVLGTHSNPVIIRDESTVNRFVTEYQAYSKGDINNG